ncbi:aldehyde dehydrogenase family protein [Streptomyces griseorubiginosus]|uniref:aldehyde dehydrogenase family protein n=1 Tax=Streptomyces griseorubiginosus TaxID=67304 RepID=UPI0033DE2C9D
MAPSLRRGGTFESVNPVSGLAWATCPRATQQDVDDAVAAARRAFEDGPWPTSTPLDRARLLRGLGDLVAEHSEELARLPRLVTGWEASRRPFAEPWPVH